MRHPDLPGSEQAVSEEAFTDHYSRSGWVDASLPVPTEPESEPEVVATHPDGEPPADENPAE